jgi:hypothetical protein
MTAERGARTRDRLVLRYCVARVATLIVVGCGAGAVPSSDQSRDVAAPATSPIGPHGSVYGRVIRPPGLDPRSGAAGACDIAVPVSGDPIAAHSPGGRTLATAVSDRAGSFTLSLPPGRYTIVEGICGVSQPVEVRSHITSSLTLTIPNSC